MVSSFAILNLVSSFLPRAVHHKIAYLFWHTLLTRWTPFKLTNCIALWAAELHVVLFSFFFLLRRRGKSWGMHWKTKYVPSTLTKTYLAATRYPGITKNLKFSTIHCLKKSKLVRMFSVYFLCLGLNVASCWLRTSFVYDRIKVVLMKRFCKYCRLHIQIFVVHILASLIFATVVLCKLVLLLAYFLTGQSPSGYLIMMSPLYFSTGALFILVFKSNVK